MNKRTKKKIFSDICYSATDNKILWKLLDMPRSKLYERVAIKEGLIKLERQYFPVSKYKLDKAIEKQVYREYLEEQGKKED